MSPVTSARRPARQLRSNCSTSVQTSTDREIWIDPTTGAIINQTESQQRLDEDGNTFLALDYGFTDEQVAGNAEDAKSNSSSLNLVTKTVPLIGWIVGIPALLIGIALQVMRRRSA